jgi:endonuclease-8
VRIHLLMFGTYRINECKEDAKPRLGLGFPGGGELNFYTCSVQLIEGALDKVYDWRVDVMSDVWDERLARRHLRDKPDALACDAILDQTIFAGAGNIFKNEVLFRIRVHPLSRVGALPPAKLRELVAQVRQYGGEFLAWKRAGVLRAHWLAHRKRVCPRCDIPYTLAKLGLTKRRSFYCERCQVRYGEPPDGKP